MLSVCDRRVFSHSIFYIHLLVCKNFPKHLGTIILYKFHLLFKLIFRNDYTLQIPFSIRIYIFNLSNQIEQIQLRIHFMLQLEKTRRITLLLKIK